MAGEIITIDDKAFFALIDRVINHIKSQNEITGDEWISGPEAMEMLRIRSKATLQKLRDEKLIEYAQLTKKIILYKVSSINEYLSNNSKKK